MAKRVALALALLLATVAAAAQSPTSDDWTATRPSVTGEPEQITLRLGLLDIAEIDDREQVFTADIFIEAQWLDPRLAVGLDAPELRTMAFDQIWHPRLTVVNSRGLDILLPQVATVDRQGRVIVRQRLAGSLAVELDLRDFPFDKQRLPIEFASYQYSQDEIVFSEDSKFVARFDELSGNGWIFEAIAAEPFVYRLDDGGRGASGFVFAVMAEREWAYFALTIALPMTVIIFLAWMVHWLPVDVIPARIGTASATVFSLIAFGVSFRLTLPKIAYLTDADRFLMGSTLLVLVSLAITVAGIRQVGNDRKDSAERLARQTRLAFPILYGLVAVLALSA